MPSIYQQPPRRRGRLPPARCSGATATPNASRAQTLAVMHRNAADHLRPRSNRRVPSKIDVGAVAVEMSSRVTESMVVAACAERWDGSPLWRRLSTSVELCQNKPMIIS